MDGLDAHLYYDSIVVQLNAHNKQESEYIFRIVTRMLALHFTKIDVVDIRQDKLVKFRKMYILKDSGYSNVELLNFFSFDVGVDSFSYFSVYARKEGVFIELHSITQYTQSYTSEKFRVLHLLYSNYPTIFSFSRIDVAVDVRSSFSDINLYDKKMNPINKSSSSSKTCFYFKKQSNTSVKIYYKTKQRNRSVVLPYHLTRIEFTFKRAKVKNISSIEDLSKRLKKEFNSCSIVISGKQLVITDVMLDSLSQDLYQVLEDGTHTLLYANRYKNMIKQATKAELSYKCFQDRSIMFEFSKVHDISYKTLRTNVAFYKSLSLK